MTHSPPGGEWVVSCFVDGSSSAAKGKNAMPVQTDHHLAQQPHWPESGRHVMAQFDDESIVVYQAYRPSIGRFAAEHGYFGGEFKFGRMSWIKPNFLWMMYRSGWGRKEGQEVVLGIRLRRDAFDSILVEAVPSSFDRTLYVTSDDWKREVATSDVRLQFDPDHDPFGSPVERRAIQLGLRGDVLARYAREWIVEIEGITPFVHEQHRHVVDHQLESLLVPAEAGYPVTDVAVHRRLRLSPHAEEE